MNTAKRSEEIIQKDQTHIMGTYGRLPVAAQKGSNARLTDADGREYIDFTSGIGVNSLGYSNPGWIQAVTEQLHAYQHISNYYSAEPCANLAEKLIRGSGLKKVFFANSGAEANEGAVKLARKYANDTFGEMKRPVIVTLKNSFHGRTMTTLTATGQEEFHKYFAPFAEGFRYTPINNIKALDKALGEDVCALMIETIQGEGGVNLMTDAFADAVSNLCRERGILLIIDEVQTGMGRTGRMFDHQYLGLKPDILTLAKGLGGGLPVGAFLCGENLAEVMGKGMHGSTFGGNPVVAAGANYVWDTVSHPDFLSEVVRKGKKIRGIVESWGLPCVKEIRGRGLMIGIAVSADIKKVLTACCEEGLLILTAGTDTLRLLPPLTIENTDIEQGLDILRRVLGMMASLPASK